MVGDQGRSDLRLGEQEEVGAHGEIMGRSGGDRTCDSVSRKRRPAWTTATTRSCESVTSEWRSSGPTASTLAPSSICSGGGGATRAIKGRLGRYGEIGRYVEI